MDSGYDTREIVDESLTHSTGKAKQFTTHDAASDANVVQRNQRTGSDNSELHAQMLQTTLNESQSQSQSQPQPQPQQPQQPPPSKYGVKRTSDEPDHGSYPFKHHLTESRQSQAMSPECVSPSHHHRMSSPPPSTPVVSVVTSSHHARPVSGFVSKPSTTTPTPIPAVPSPSSDSAGSVENTIVKQPPTRPISEQQLINEVKGIYAGLVMVEKKCIEIVTQQSQSTKRLEDQQWKALVALHRTLLQEHHDFFSASQHPTASDALKRLATKYAMPARMWRHGIHAFLELLRHRLPDSMEHMLSFIYLSYSMMALLKESVKSFEETWIECLGDLARYRMAIEDSDPRDREIWSNVARMWYNEAADKSPDVGRIQHHLAVLARPNIVEQQFYYTRALISVVPFVNARESIMLLFDMFLKKNEAVVQRYPVTESALVHALALLFTRGPVAQFHVKRDDFRTTLSGHIDRIGSKLKTLGPQIAMALFAGLVDFCKDDSQPYLLYRAHTEELNQRKQVPLEPGQTAATLEIQAKHQIQDLEFNTITFDSPVARVSSPPSAEFDGNMDSSETVISLAGILFSDTVSIIASRIGDKNVVPFFHAVLASIWGWSFVPGALVFVESMIPWLKIEIFLNTIGRSGISYSNIESDVFPPSFGGFGRQLPEDFQLRGFIMTAHYYPPKFWFEQLVDEDERTVELPSHQAPRAERCLWLGVRLTTLKRYLTYDDDTKQFACTEFAKSLCTP